MKSEYNFSDLSYKTDIFSVQNLKIKMKDQQFFSNCSYKEPVS